MADPTEAEMMADLQAADAAGDTELAQHIAGRIKAARVASAPKVGMGDVREAENKDAVVGKAANVPVSFMTGDPETDRRMAENAYAQGVRRLLTTGDALRAGAVAAGLGASALPVGPVLGGALSGALMSGGLSKSNDVSGIASDAAKGGVIGGAAGYAIPKAIGLVAAGANKVAPWFGGKAIEYGRKAITGVSSPLARRKPLDEAAVEQAFKLGAIRPGSTVSDIAERLQGPADDLAQRYSDVLKALEAKGVHGPEAAKMAADLASDAQQAASSSIIGTRANALGDAAEALASKPLPISGQGRLGLMQSELMKRELQTAAANDFVKEGPQSLAGGARKEIAGRFRQAIEDAVQQQASKAPAEAAQFQPVKEELHRTLQALGPAREAAARHARRSPFGLHEAMGLASGIASGNPIEAVGSVGLMNALKERGASTMAAGYRGIADALSSPAPAASPVLTMSATQALAEALRRRLPSMRFEPVPVAADEQ